MSTPRESCDSMLASRVSRPSSSGQWHARSRYSKRRTSSCITSVMSPRRSTATGVLSLIGVKYKDLISRLTVSCLTFFVTLFVADIATAQSLSDFKDAAGKEGCDSIPYSSLRSSCQSKQRDVDRWCKGSKGVWSREGLDPEGLKKQMENVKRKIDELKKEKANLASTGFQKFLPTGRARRRLSRRGSPGPSSASGHRQSR